MEPVPSEHMEPGQDIIQRQLSALSSTARGKGQFICTFGTQCTKGGATPTGDVVVFERNSAFKYAQNLLFFGASTSCVQAR